MARPNRSEVAAERAEKALARNAALKAEDPSAFKKVGRFVALGLREPYQVALLLPTGYDDFRQVLPSLDAAESEERALIWLEAIGEPRSTFSSGTPRTTCSMRDATGRVVRATAIGESDVWLPRLTNAAGYFLVQPNEYRGELQVRILEVVASEWVGRLRPKYPGKPNYLAAEKVRDTVTTRLHKMLPLAAGFIERELAPLVQRDQLLSAAGVPDWTLEQVIEETHMPASPRMGETAREALHRIAAFAALAKAHSHTLNRPPARALDLSSWPVRMGQLPYTSTPEQRSAVLDCVRDMRQRKAMARVLVGDVGTGKTTVFGTVAVAAVDAGGRVAVLLPNQVLAEQVHRELEEVWGDVKPCLVLGDSTAEDLADRQLLVGTTALLHRNVGSFDLVVVDEEQKFSVEQKAALAKAQAHMLTCSATCIPRTQALAKYGAVGISELRQSHVAKTISTRLWAADDKRALMGELAHYLMGGQQLLIVYPMKEAGEELDPLLSVDVASQVWERLYPGKVRILTGDSTKDEKTTVMADMRAGRAQILIATTVVEVGVTLPDLYRAMIVAPERLGLTTIHQLRGRVGRKGGTGWCDLYSPLPLKDNQRDKLAAFTRCRDGFEVAELDLKLRGFGDLAAGGSKQSGADDSFLFGSAITPDHVAPMEALWAQLRGGANHGAGEGG